MLKNFFTDHVNSILGAISFHLLIIAVFLWLKLGEAKNLQKEEVYIEFNEEVTPPEEKPKETRSIDESDMGMAGLDDRTVHAIASNVASKLNEEISTEKYEREVMDELGISSLKSQSSTEKNEVQEDEEAVAPVTDSKPEKENEPALTMPNVLRKENTTVSYFLENRWHQYVYIPTYKCQGGGTVILDIVIDQSGKVISALISENKSTKDPCLLDEAYQSAITARFNPDKNAPAKQLGTITYVFLPQ
jgi:TonB family protein